MSLEKIQKNLSDIERKSTKSNKILSKGEKLTLGDAIKLGQKSNSIVKTINKGIKDYSVRSLSSLPTHSMLTSSQTYTPTEAEAKTIFTQMERLVVCTEEQLDLLVKNKPQLEKLHIGGLVKKNMQKSAAASDELSKVMLAKTPESIKPQAETLEKRRTDGFNKAQAAFAQSKGGEDQALGEDDSD
jgi:hypothetical protein